MYSVEGLRHGIERAEHNVRALEEAIERERQTIADYKIMIAGIERAEKKKQEALDGVHVEVIHGDPQ